MKQVLVIRKDLKMRTGKIAAQAAHASMAAILDSGKLSDRLEVSQWLANSFTKICVYVNSEEELINVYESAMSLDIPCSMITDNGRTEFHGVPTRTAVAVGPAEIGKINQITGNLPLL